MDLFGASTNKRILRVPHTRGDGPDYKSLIEFLTESSPHTWGWTSESDIKALDYDEFPTHVGMDLGASCSSISRRRVPHTRGDGPTCEHIGYDGSMSSPHTWGWTSPVERRLFDALEFPTHVGMDLNGALGSTARAGVPHTRGDGPMSMPPVSAPSSSSPHTWGWTFFNWIIDLSVKEFPTHVGMDLRAHFAICCTYRVPHTRGDGPLKGANTFSLPQSSPHTWGWTGMRRTAINRYPEFPTHVGMDLKMKNITKGGMRVPHTRGDGPWASLNDLLRHESSPHTWGWTSVVRPYLRAYGEFPTHVGMDLQIAWYECLGWGVPHTRGDGPVNLSIIHHHTGSSPHTWGWTYHIQYESDTRHEFPTHVGMDLCTCRFSTWFARVPHTRGDGPRLANAISGETVSSPHTWGWTSDQLYADLGRPRVPYTCGDGSITRSSNAGK